MKLNSLHEAGHWQVLRGGPKKGKMSFLLGGVEDRNKFLKSMKMEDILNEQPFYCRKCGSKILPKSRVCQCGHQFETSLDSIIQIADTIKTRTLPDLLNLLKGSIYEQALPATPVPPEAPVEPVAPVAPESRAVMVTFEDDYGSYRIFKVQIPATSEDGVQGYLNSWYACSTDQADEERIRQDVLENIMSYRTFFKAGNIKGAEEALWGTKDAPILIPKLEDAQKLAEKLNAAYAEEQAAPLGGIEVETIEEAAEIPMEISIEKTGKAHDMFRIFIPEINDVLFHIWKKPRRGEPFFGASGKQKANKIRKDLKENIVQYVIAKQKNDKGAMKKAITRAGKVILRPNRDDATDIFDGKEHLATLTGELRTQMAPADIGPIEKYELRKAKDRLKRWKDARKRKENIGTIDRGTIVRRLDMGDISDFIYNYITKKQALSGGTRRLNPLVDIDKVAEFIPHTTVDRVSLDLLIRDNDIIVDHLSPDGQVALAIAALIGSAALKAGTVEMKA